MGRVSDIIYLSRVAWVTFTSNFRLLASLLKILDICEGEEEGASDIIYDSRGVQVLFAPNFSLLTQFFKILEFCHEDLNFEKLKSLENNFFVNNLKSLKGGDTEKIGPFRWKLLEKLIEDWSWATQNFILSTTFSQCLQIYRNWVNMEFWVGVVVILTKLLKKYYKKLLKISRVRWTFPAEQQELNPFLELDICRSWIRVKYRSYVIKEMFRVIS